MRVCSKCKKNKEDQAFVGSRGICRFCWAELLSDEKMLNISRITSTRLWRHKLRDYEANENADDD